MKRFKYVYILIAAGVLIFTACRTLIKEEGSEVNSVKTPVSAETLRSIPMDAIITLPAVSAYLKKETVRASSSGYIVAVARVLGERVKAGDLLMQIRTKEASALKSVARDSSLHISGMIDIKANSDGIISRIDHQFGDYISEGDPLITLAQPGSLVFYLKVPFAEHASIHPGENYSLLLPDGTRISSRASRLLTTMETGSQTEDYILESYTDRVIPENLWINVPIKKMSHSGNFSLPEECIQSNETQTEFWVMKLTSDSVAIKVNIRKGIESDSLIEILSPLFNRYDRFVSKGSFGLTDTARIEIAK